MLSASALAACLSCYRFRRSRRGHRSSPSADVDVRLSIGPVPYLAYSNGGVAFKTSFVAPANTNLLFINFN